MNTSEFDNLIFCPDADTLAIIDPISTTKRAWSVEPTSCQSIGHRVHSSKLLATGSPLLKYQFEPRTQARNIRRRGGLPEGISYIIDLTPPSTDEDAVLFLTELSCPLGIRNWSKSTERWDLPRLMVAGFDVLDEQDQNGDLAEYSPSRHRAGIVHVLQVIEGQAVFLNTPCKLWNFFAVAKLYEIAHLPEISIRVRSWVYEENNRRLIELYPEIAYRLAKGTHCPHMMQDAFSVLAGEEALLVLRNDGGAPKTSREHQVTVHGRVQDSLDDDDVQRVQYAGESFLGYVIEKFVELAGTEMRWLENCSLVQNILKCPPEAREGEGSEIVDNYLKTLKDFVRSSIVIRLCQWSRTKLPAVRKTDPNPTGGYPTDEFWDAFGTMTALERMMTRTFWQHLHDNTLTPTRASLGFIAPGHPHLASLGLYKGAFRDQEGAVIRRVTARELEQGALAFNRHLLNNTQTVNEGGSNVYTPGRYDFDGAFNVSDFISEAHFFRVAFAKNMLSGIRPGMTYELTDSITCLTDAQYRYLPLWAGGCDDGTGGVYADQIPLAEVDGFSAPGPSIHTGSAAPSEAPSSIASFVDSTVHGASHRATEGFRSEVVSVASETDSESEFQKVDAKLDMELDSSADDQDDFDFDYDSDDADTVVGENGDGDGDVSGLSDFEDLDLNENERREMNLPIRERTALP